MMEFPSSRSKIRTVPVALAGVLVGVALTVGVVVLTPAGEWLSGGSTVEDRAAAEELWTCPMHPQILQEEPGSCPICGMDLVPVEREADEAEPRAAAADHGQEELWTCPMHPQILQEEPGSCPICGMDLVPVEASADQGHAGEHPPDAVRQAATVRIDPAVVQNMNVVTQRVERSDIRRRIRTVGYLDYDQDAMVTVTTKYPGFIEKVYVNYVGQPVSAGEPLFEVYSPELVQTQKELLAAVRYTRRLEDAPDRTRERAEALVEAARQRLAYWDISDSQIARLEASGQTTRTLTVSAPASGLVMKVMHGLEGMRISPGMDVLHIAGMSSLWLTVEVFEDQLAWLEVGSRATVSFTYFPGEVSKGRVRYIEPEVDERTRTVQLTLAVPNPSGRLRVGMYATVLFEPVVIRDAVAVPTQAVLRTGERSVVVVALGNGRFAPRDVTLGVEGDGSVRIVEGLRAGEEIVTSAQFLIDSESNLREAISKMTGETRSDLSHSH
jgi:RND family efflux transporter MFP subunit